jgi:hypothetical protein
LNTRIHTKTRAHTHTNTNTQSTNPTNPPTPAPYGLREGSRKKATGCGAHHDATEHWDIGELSDALLHFAAETLEMHGRLVFWLPFIKDDYSDAQLPAHPCLTLVANAPQHLAGPLGRRLITMEKTRAFDPADTAAGRRARVAMQADLHARYYHSSSSRVADS